MILDFHWLQGEFEILLQVLGAPQTALLQSQRGLEIRSKKKGATFFYLQLSTDVFSSEKTFWGCGISKSEKKFGLDVIKTGTERKAVGGENLVAKRS